MTDEMVMLSGRVPAELKERVDHDPRTNQEVLKDALKHEFATEEEAAVLQRLDELEREMSELESQKNARERQIAEKAEEKERLEKSLERIEKEENAEEERKRELWERAVTNIRPPQLSSVDTETWQPETSDEAVQHFAAELEISPEEFVEHYPEKRAEVME